MSMIDRSLDGMAFLSGQLGAILRRRLREVGGIALISLAMMAALALATWSVRDPSLSHATDAPVHNLLGRPGAIAADLLMQLFGLGSLALLLPIAVWGYRLLGHRPLSRERLRVVLWLFGAALCGRVRVVPAARQPLAAAVRAWRRDRRRRAARAGDNPRHAARGNLSRGRRNRAWHCGARCLFRCGRHDLAWLAGRRGGYRRPRRRQRVDFAGPPDACGPEPALAAVAGVPPPHARAAADAELRRDAAAYRAPLRQSAGHSTRTPTSKMSRSPGRRSRANRVQLHGRRGGSPAAIHCRRSIS